MLLSKGRERRGLLNWNEPEARVSEENADHRRKRSYTTWENTPKQKKKKKPAWEKKISEGEGEKKTPLNSM